MSKSNSILLGSMIVSPASPCARRGKIPQNSKVNTLLVGLTFPGIRFPATFLWSVVRG